MNISIVIQSQYDGAENFICDPCKLLSYKIKYTPINNLNLYELKTIANEIDDIDF